MNSEEKFNEKKDRMQEKDSKISLIRSLNSVQKQAVESINGPNLILAGAGSGKTRVLTHKIGYLIDRKKINPANILAMTFTNKAAKEMKERISYLLKGEIRGLWVSTFHSSFARIIRLNCEKLGYTNNFVIYDESDQLSLIKTVIKELDILKVNNLKPKSVQIKIKYLKNGNFSLEDLKTVDPAYANQTFYDIFNLYQKKLQENNAMDFDDLLLKSLELFRLFPSVLEHYQKQFKYILVDEYQDTNRVQYQLLKLLSAGHRNISVVGDDDQSIYRWRGADIRNILDFEKDFPDCKVFRLEQNYRSTSNILKIAHSIISHNFDRMDKELWTKNDFGEKTTLSIINSVVDEANYIAQKIEEEIQTNQRNFSDFAILYRINAQSRAIEDVLKNKGIAYIVVGGIRFYERKEVKDILAYLRILVNPKDSVSVKRIINYPQRGIGQATIDKLEKFSVANNCTFFESLGRVKQVDSIPERKQKTIADFYNLLQKYIDLMDDIPIIELITTLVEDLEIFSLLKEEGTFEGHNRIENIRELITGIDEYIKKNPGMTLENYLENVALVTAVDNWDTNANVVSLLTLHSAKGLEFPVVFICGLEEGLFPLMRQMENDDELEEERRLFYVGCTRAKQKLYLSSARYRRMPNDNSNGSISRFLTEIDRDLLEVEQQENQASDWKRRRSPGIKKTIRFQNSNNFGASNKVIQQGSHVNHPRFGKGVVRKIEGSGEDQKAYILFEELGEKNISIKYGNLEIIT